MSRITAREALIASGTVSAVASLCLVVGAAAPTASAASEGGHVATATGGSDGWAAAGSPSPLLFSSSLGPDGLDGVYSAYRDAWFGAAVGTAGSPGVAAPSGDGDDVETVGLPVPAVSSAAATTTTAVHPTASAEAVAGGPRAIARQQAATYNWTGNQWTCLDKLWDHESKYRTTVRNPVSGAYGIPQALPASKMRTAGADWRTNPATQIAWGLAYIEDRYGSPCGAWSYWLRHNSY